MKLFSMKMIKTRLRNRLGEILMKIAIESPQKKYLMETWKRSLMSGTPKKFQGRVNAPAPPKKKPGTGNVLFMCRTSVVVVIVEV